MASEAQSADTLQSAGSWTNESNYTDSGDNNCMYTTTQDHVSGEFSFPFSAIGDSDTIDGIEVTCHCLYESSSETTDVELYDSTSTWRTKTTTSAPQTGGNQCSQSVDETVGGAADTWGGTWTGSHIKSTNFRIRLKKNYNTGVWNVHDCCTVTVYYTAAAAGGANQPIVDDGSNELIVDDGTNQKIVD